MPLERHIHLVVGRCPDRNGLAHDPRVLQYHAAQLVAGPGADQGVEQAALLATVDLGKKVLDGGFDQGGVIGVDERLLLQDGRVEKDIQFDVGLPEGRVPLAHDAGEQQGQKQDAQENRRQPEKTEAPLGPVAPGSGRS